MRKTRKKVCKVCGKRYTPNQKTARFQKTCGVPTCQRELHRLSCSKLNEANSRDDREFRARQRVIIQKDEDDQSVGKLYDCVDWKRLQTKDIDPELIVILKEILFRLTRK